MPQPVQFYFEFSSPYGYLASFRIDDIAATNHQHPDHDTQDWPPGI